MSNFTQKNPFEGIGANVEKCQSNITTAIDILLIELQMNQVTHWLDLSLIYGSSEYLAKSLREHRGGLLLYQSLGLCTLSSKLNTCL